MPEKWIGEIMSTKQVMDNWRNWGWLGLYTWLLPHYESLSEGEKLMLDELRNVEHFTYIRNPRRYYESDYWASLRKRMMAEATCWVCETSQSLHLHHRHYNSIYREDENSVVVLCSKCHILVHPFGSMADRKDDKIKDALELSTNKEVKKREGELYDLTVSRILSNKEEKNHDQRRAD